MPSPFDPDQLLADCRAAAATDAPAPATREVLARAVADPAAVVRALGEPTRAGITPLYRSDELTVLNVVWGPGMTLPPHEHRMWGLIAIYTGREDNIFWRRIDDDERGPTVEAAGARALREREVLPMGRDLIHSVTNPIPRLTGALHVYGGEFFTRPRSEWDPETLVERPFDVERAQRLFEASNAALAPR